MKITLYVRGQEMTFSEEELVAILEKHLDYVSTTQEDDQQVVDEAKQQISNNTTEMKEIPEPKHEVSEAKHEVSEPKHEVLKEHKVTESTKDVSGTTKKDAKATKELVLKMAKSRMDKKGKKQEFTQEVEENNKRENRMSQPTMLQVANTTQQEEKSIVKPIEGVHFDINPLAIERSLFEKAREDPEQEETRKSILNALKMVDERPDKYGKPFKTLRIKALGTWGNFESLRKMAIKKGHHMADGVETALELAQRIANGESWECICNEPDDASWFRAIMWKNGQIALAGGSQKYKENYSPSHIISGTQYELRELIPYAIPGIVAYVV